MKKNYSSVLSASFLCCLFINGTYCYAENISKDGFIGIEEGLKAILKSKIKNPGNCAVEAADGNKLASVINHIRKDVRNSIVQIYGEGQPGTGFIVKREKGNYTVITAAHVLSGTTTSNTPVLITSDDKEYPIISIKQIGQLDLAELKFKSDTFYKPIPTRHACKGSPVLVIGYPINSDKQVATFGLVNAVGSTLSLRPGGYVLQYSTRIPTPSRFNLKRDTYIGMSGSPILTFSSEDYHVVGVHGEASIYKGSSSFLTSKSGAGYGIPLKATINGLEYGYTSFYSDSLVPIKKDIYSSDDLYIFDDLLRSKGLFHESLLIINKLINHDSTDFSHYALKAQLLETLGSWDQALEYWDNAIALGIDDNYGMYLAPYYVNRGNNKFKHKNYEGSIQDYMKAIEISPNDMRAHMQLMNAYFATRQYAEAINVAQSIEENQRTEAIISYYLQSLVKIDKNKALLESAKYQKIFPGSEIIAAARIVIIEEAYTREEVLKEVKNLKVYFPSSPFILSKIAVYELDVGNPSLAYDALKSLTRLEPDKASHNAYACYALWKQEKHSQAILECNIALSKDPNLVISYRYRGLARTGLGQSVLALEDFTSVIDKGDYGDHEIDFLNRGELYWQLGNKDSACTDFKTAVTTSGSKSLSHDFLKGWDSDFTKYCSIN